MGWGGGGRWSVALRGSLGSAFHTLAMLNGKERLRIWVADVGSVVQLVGISRNTGMVAACLWVSGRIAELWQESK